MDNKKILYLFLFALILRIAFILTLDNSVDVWGDWWDELGWKIASGKGYWVDNPYFPDGPKFYAWRSPGFPLFLALIYKIFGHNYLTAKIGLAVLSSLTVILIFFLGKTLIDEKKGILASIIYSIYPPSIFWTGYLAPETITTFFLTLSIFLILKSEKENLKILNLILGGLSFGYLCITRPTFLLIIPFVFLIFFWKYKIKFFKKSLPFLLSIIIFPFLWGLRNFIILKHFVVTSTEGGIVFFIANNEYSLSSPSGFYHSENVDEFKGLSEVEIDKLLYKKTFDFIQKNPKIFLKLLFDRFFRFWRFYPHTISGPGEAYKKIHQIISFITETPIIILGFLGIFISFREFKSLVLIYSVIFLYSGISIFIRTTIRYRFPIMGFLILFALYFLEKCKYEKKCI
ncbi:MAG TPA: glycosyltransferase family 39 protein [bacterium]|nr:glycosyltransferase family 39 protein [bacterium]